MIYLKPAQEYYIKSILQNFLKDLSQPVTIYLHKGVESEPFRIYYADENTIQCLNISQNKEIHLRTDEFQESIVQALREREFLLFIEKNGETTQLKIQGQSIVREKVPQSPAILKNPRWAVGKSTHLDPDQAAPLLKAIGLMTPDGEIKAAMRRKFKQVNHFLDLLSPLLDRKEQSSVFQVVDCGCGKSYLGFALYWYLTKVLKRKASFVGIDTSSKLIEDCRDKADTLSLDSMNFQCASILDAEFPRAIDLLISLHACDTATDEALACGIVQHAKHIAAAPCCQHELADQLDGIPNYPLKKHGLFTQRFAEMLTDMARSLCLEAQGYSVTVGEFISSDATPKNLLIRASRGNSNPSERAREYEAFKTHYQISPSLDTYILEREALSQR